MTVNKLRYYGKIPQSILNIQKIQQKQLEKYKVKNWFSTKGAEKRDRINYSIDLEYPYYYCNNIGRKLLNIAEETPLLEYNLLCNKRNKTPSFKYKKPDGAWSSYNSIISLNEAETSKKYNKEIITDIKGKYKAQQGHTYYCNKEQLYLIDINILMNAIKEGLFTDMQKQYIQDVLDNKQYLYSRNQIMHYTKGIQKRINQLNTSKCTNNYLKIREGNNKMIKTSSGTNQSFEYLDKSEKRILEKFVMYEEALPIDDLGGILNYKYYQPIIDALIKKEMIYYYKEIIRNAKKKIVSEDEYYGATLKGIEYIDKRNSKFKLLNRKTRIENFLVDTYIFTMNKKETIKACDVYKDYKIYCQLRNDEPLGKKKFYKHMEEEQGMTKNPGAGGFNMYRGITYKPGK